jgi:hypothetical protein
MAITDQQAAEGLFFLFFFWMHQMILQPGR